jgi:murein DD-endopeptidase MepM/ murein hydrolase activator NlpD
MGLLVVCSVAVFAVGLITGAFVSRVSGQRTESALGDRVAALHAQAEELEGQLASLREDETRLRISAGLEPLHEDVLMVGVGGAQYVPPRSGADYAQAKLDRLGRATGLLKSSFAQVGANLSDRTERWRKVPCIHPVPGSLTMGRFGMRTHPILGVWAMHEGADFGARKGTPIVATADGVVRFSGWKPGFGYTVKVDHGGGCSTVYAHNSKNKVKKGQRVRRGEVIALLGSTGLSTGPHLHYEVRLAGNPKDPLQHILPDVVVD